MIEFEVKVHMPYDDIATDNEVRARGESLGGWFCARLSSWHRGWKFVAIAFSELEVAVEFAREYQLKTIKQPFAEMSVRGWEQWPDAHNARISGTSRERATSDDAEPAAKTTVEQS